MLKLTPTMMVLGLTSAMSSITSADGRCISGWNCGRSLYNPYGYKLHPSHRQSSDTLDIFGEIMSIPFYSSNPWFQQFDDQLAQVEKDLLPRYAISNSKDSKFAELTIELPGVSAKDISVELENGNVIRVHGSRTVRENGSIATTQFDQSFTLDSDVDVEKISVTLESGILTITAPKKESGMKRIPLAIQERVTDGEKAALPIEGNADDSEAMVGGNEDGDATGQATGKDELEISEEEDL